MRNRVASTMLLAGLVLWTPGAVAQVVRGEVVTRDSVPVRGAILVLMDSLGAEPARALTGLGGVFELRAPRAGTYRLRVEAVGYSSVLSLPFVLGATERRTQRIHLADATRRLAAVQVRARSRCDLEPEEGTQVALLWTEARKTLATVLLSVGQMPLLAFDTDLIDYDSAARRVTLATRTSVAAQADEGYRSESPSSLRDRGYIQRLDNLWITHMPDARVLLSDEFASAHCFSIVDRDPTSPARVGLKFEPTERPRRGYAGITGTLWLEREGYALDRLEYRYTPRQSDEHPDTLFGGWIRFERIASGPIMIRRWELRAPTFAPVQRARPAMPGAPASGRSETPEKVVGVRVVRGMARGFEEEPSPLPPVTAQLRRSADPPDCYGLQRDASRIEVMGEVTNAAGRPVGGARVRASWTPVVQDSSAAGRQQWAESGADANGRFMLCALPRGVEVRIRATGPRGATAEAAMTAGERGAVAPVKLVIADR